MTQLYEIKVSLSPNQKKNLSNAYHKRDTHVQYSQTESNRLKAKTIRVSSRIKDFRLTGSPFSGTRLAGSQDANKCAGR